MSERRRNRRLKSFLRGFVYFDKKRGALSCIIRDFNEAGARIIFSENVTIPNIVNLHLPQKDQTLRAKVTWRRGDEIGLGFIAEDAPEAPLPDAKELMKRVAELELQIVSLRRMLKRLKSQQPPSHHDDEAAA
jgi:PilZ domain